MLELSVIQKIVIWALPLIFAITGHEVAHGWVANRFGDPTARLLGRLSLNPMKHIDWMGTVIIPLVLLSVSNFVFGWAKPVPIDPRHFRHPRRDNALVALAGPCANIVMALLWATIGRLGVYLIAQHYAWLGVPLVYMGSAGIMINVVLGVLNILPFPPLDGSKILYSLLPYPLVQKIQQFEPWGFLLLMFLWVTGILSVLLFPPVIFIIQWMSAVFGLNNI